MYIPVISIAVVAGLLARPSNARVIGSNHGTGDPARVTAGIRVRRTPIFIETNRNREKNGTLEVNEPEFVGYFDVIRGEVKDFVEAIFRYKKGVGKLGAIAKYDTDFENIFDQLKDRLQDLRDALNQVHKKAYSLHHQILLTERSSKKKDNVNDTTSEEHGDI